MFAAVFRVQLKIRVPAAASRFKFSTDPVAANDSHRSVSWIVFLFIFGGITPGTAEGQAAPWRRPMST
jgi:hypothetical protein